MTDENITKEQLEQFEAIAKLEQQIEAKQGDHNDNQN